MDPTPLDPVPDADIHRAADDGNPHCGDTADVAQAPQGTGADG